MKNLKQLSINTKYLITSMLIFILVINAYSRDHNKITSWMYKGDINGDNIEELLQINGRFLTVYRPDFTMTPVLSHRFDSNIRRLVIGDFVSRGREHGKEQIAAILANGSIQVFAISNDLSELWWWFTQGNFIHSYEHYQIGDFDGDYADEIMVHNPRNGKLRFYEIAGTAFFRQKNNYSLGNLGSHDLRNKTILVNEVRQGNRMNPNIILIDNRYRQLLMFETARPNGGNFTFWWGFTTVSNLYNQNSDVYSVNIDGGNDDDILIRDNKTGAYSFYKFKYYNGRLRPINSVSVGQLPIINAKANIIPIQTGTTQKVRDNILYVQENGSRAFILTGSAYSTSSRKNTYWWAYTTTRPFIGSNFTFDNRITKEQVLTLLERHRFAYFQIWNCNSLNNTERDSVGRVYRSKIHHGIETRSNVNASASIGGRTINVNFQVLFPSGNREIAQTLIHEMMHCSNYTHPDRRDSPGTCPDSRRDCPGDNGQYYGTAPLRAELCIAGIQTDALACELSEDGHSCHIKHVENSISTDKSSFSLGEKVNNKMTFDLFQNHPNPFHRRTIIKYTVPDHEEDVSMKITNISGKLIKHIPIQKNGEGQIEVDLEGVSSGIYFYSLLIKGNIVSTKKMILLD